MKSSIWCVAFSMVIFSACQNNSEPVEEHAAVSKDTVTHHEKHHQKASEVSLDNGNKWVANPETTEGINKMKALVAGYDQQTEGNYSSLKENLETEFNLILQKCTMTGDAHEQLHNYLLPMTEMFKNLNSEDMHVRKEAVDELKQHLNAYDNYFQ
jgi:hypothetical protein